MLYACVSVILSSSCSRALRCDKLGYIARHRRRYPAIDAIFFRLDAGITKGCQMIVPDGIIAAKHDLLDKDRSGQHLATCKAQAIIQYNRASIATAAMLDIERYVADGCYCELPLSDYLLSTNLSTHFS